MLGRFDESRRILAENRAELADRGGGLLLGNVTGIDSVAVALLAGEPAEAARLSEEGCRLLEQIAFEPFLALATGMRARALYAFDRLDDADTWARRAAELSSEDVLVQMFWRQAAAKVLARRGQHAEACRIAREAAAVCEDTDLLDAKGDVFADLAEVHLLAGKPGEATAALQRALGCFERKGNLVSAQRARARLTALRDSPSG
jgi:tetratricopeptide (TPR) repeat protein